jgi:hypothetical protein
MVKRGSKSVQSNGYDGIFKMALYGTLGGLVALTATALLSLVFFVPGYLLIRKYNKPGTDTFDELTTQQYVGLGLCTIGMLPWIRYVFLGFGLEAGGAIFDSLNE